MLLHIFGDTHGPLEINKINPKRFLGRALNDSDAIVICGDFGFPFLPTDCISEDALKESGAEHYCILGGMNSGMMISDSPALEFAAIYYGLPVGVRNLSVSMFVWIILSFFLVLAILWQTDLSKQKLNRTALLCLGGNMLLTCLSRGIVEWLVSGVAEGLFTMLVILASLLVMVGGGIGMAYLVQKKNGALDTYEAFSDIMTEEEFEKWQRRKNRRS